MNEQRIAYSGKRIENQAQLTVKRFTLNAEKGFTLIEVMISASILGVISLAVLTTFGSGLHVYERVQSYGGRQADVLIGLEEMERDLRNAIPFSAVKFTGDAQSIEFPIIVDSVVQAEEGGKLVPTVGKVSYSLKGGLKASVLMRGQSEYGQAYSKRSVGDGQERVLADISGLHFSYYYFDKETEESGWKDDWSTEEENIPVAVKVEVVYEGRGQEIQLARTVMIPAQRVIVEEEDDEGEEGEGGGDE